MARKKIRNNFRDRLADYYRINREITKESDERYRKEKRDGVKEPWTGSEKTMVLIIVIALVLLALKYLVFK